MYTDEAPEERNTARGGQSPHSIAETGMLNVEIIAGGLHPTALIIMTRDKELKQFLAAAPTEQGIPGGSSGCHSCFSAGTG